MRANMYPHGTPRRSCEVLAVLAQQAPGATGTRRSVADVPATPSTPFGYGTERAGMVLHRARGVLSAIPRWPTADSRHPHGCAQPLRAHGSPPDGRGLGAGLGNRVGSWVGVNDGSSVVGVPVGLAVAAAANEIWCVG